MMKIMFATALCFSMMIHASCFRTSETRPPTEYFKEKGTKIEVETRSGWMRGLDLGEIYGFKGIPYASPLEGLSRWLPPTPPQPWTGVLDATEFGQICQQPPLDLSEDPPWWLSEAGELYTRRIYSLREMERGSQCLNLNVWTPSLDARAGLPVMVFIHGGFLESGSSANPLYNGSALARQGVVFVSLNYRLGMMGFLAGDGLYQGEVLKGNRGFMDQMAALEWLQAHIADFGENPNNVTIIGHSEGGTSVWALLASPQTKGLIHRAIIQSGPIHLVSLAEQQKLTRLVLQHLEIEAGDVEALATLSRQGVAAGTFKLKDIMYSAGWIGGKRYEGITETKMYPHVGTYGTEFLPEDIFTALAQGSARHIDLLIGSNRHDGRRDVIYLPLPALWAMKFENKFLSGMIASDEKGRDALYKQYKAILPQASSYTIHEQIHTDARYRMRAIQAAAIHSRQKGGRTYMYQFNWESPVADGKLGAFHGLDLPFAMNNLQFRKHLIGDLEAAQPLATAMSEAWVSFARTGKPVSASLPEWPLYEEDARQTMIFDRDSHVVSDPDRELRQSWPVYPAPVAEPAKGGL